MKYNANTLNDVINRDGCVFIGEYPHLTIDTRIHFICGDDDCYITHDKSLERLVLTGGFCKRCTYDKALQKRIKTNNELFGRDNPFQNEEIKKKIAETNIERYGHAYATQNVDIKKKMIETNLEKYGVENTFQAEEFKDKSKETNMERFGVPFASQCDEVKQKMKETNMERYGVPFATQCDEVKQKMKETNMERFGVPYSSQCDEVKQKVKETNMERFGVPFATQCNEVKLRIKETNMYRYGVPCSLHCEENKLKTLETNRNKYGHDYPMQNPEIAERCMKASYYRKEYTFPCGKIASVQGYEPLALDILVNEGYTSDDLIVAENEVPEIWYNKDGKSHRYYCDIYITEENRIIEVKSDWTITIETGNVEEKAQASIKSGFEYEIWVFDGKGNRKIIKY